MLARTLCQSASGASSSASSQTNATTSATGPPPSCPRRTAAARQRRRPLLPGSPGPAGSGEALLEERLQDLQLAFGRHPWPVGAPERVPGAREGPNLRPAAPPVRREHRTHPTTPVGVGADDQLVRLGRVEHRPACPGGELRDRPTQRLRPPAPATLSHPRPHGQIVPRPDARGHQDRRSPTVRGVCRLFGLSAGLSG